MVTCFLRGDRSLQHCIALGCVVLVVGCSDSTTGVDAALVDATAWDSGSDVSSLADTPLDADAEIDAARNPDAGAALDSSMRVESDSGQDATATVDVFVASDDASIVPVDAVAPDAPTDAGPRRPLGRAVDITGNDCGLDEAGAFWCWGTGSTVLFGDGFDQAQGSCAMRGDEVWCADTLTTTMQPVLNAMRTPLHMDSIAEYSDRAFGCGVHMVGGFGEVLCWTNNIVTIREGGGVNAVAVMAPAVRDWATSRRPALPLYFATANVEMFDANPPGLCRTELVTHRTTCTPYGSGPAYLGFAMGDARLGFSKLCSYAAGNVSCGGTFSFPAPGMIDYAIFGTGAGAVQWGVCISGDELRCYNSDGSSRAVAW